MKTPNNQVRPWTFRMDGKAVPGLPSLQRIVAVLNGQDESPRASGHSPLVTEILRDLVRRWEDAGWNVEKLCAWEPGLEEALQKLFLPPLYIPMSGGGARLLPVFAGPAAMTGAQHLIGDRAFKDLLVNSAVNSLGHAASGGDAFKRAFRGESEHEMSEESLKNILADCSLSVFLAIQYFGALTVLDWHKLGGPCGRCQKYYIKRRASQKVYCSRRCGNATTATLRTAEQRDRERKEKLQRAQKAIQQWKLSAKRTKWKEFVSKKTALTSKWLTRAIGRNDLKAPKQEGV
jgi:hypothetical protein